MIPVDNPDTTEKEINDYPPTPHNQQIINQLRNSTPDEKRQLIGNKYQGLEWAIPNSFIPQELGEMLDDNSKPLGAESALREPLRISLTGEPQQDFAMQREYSILKERYERNKARKREYAREWARKQAAKRKAEKDELESLKAQLLANHGETLKDFPNGETGTLKDFAEAGSIITNTNTNTNTNTTDTLKAILLEIRECLFSLKQDVEDSVTAIGDMLENNQQQQQLQGSRIILTAISPDDNNKEEKITFVATTEQQYRDLLVKFATSNCKLMDRINGYNSCANVQVEPALL